MEDNRYRNDRVRGVAAAMTCVWILGNASTALAWKPFTHVRLAYEAAQEAIDTGKVTIYKTNFREGTLVGNGETYGRYDVAPELLEALRRYPEKFYAGVLGPDAYPDIVTGQTMIHPPGGDENGPDVNLHGPGTNYFLKHLWRKAHTDAANRANKAFVAGYLAHAAGDMYGHTYINSYAGGIFDTRTQNALKHIALEGYIAERTPDLPRNIYTKVKNDGIDNGVDDFIRRFGNPYSLPVNAGDNKTLSFPHTFSRLKAWLQGKVDWYNGEISWFNRKIDRALDQASSHYEAGNDCGFWDYNCSRAWEYLEAGEYVAVAAAYKVAKTGFQAVFAAPIEYARHWIEDIADGLADWPRVSHRVAIALMFNADKTAKWEDAEDALRDFREQFLRMVGLPDFVAAAIDGIARFLDNLLPPGLKQAYDAAKRAALDWVMRKALGKTWEQVKDAFISPHAILDRVFGNPRPSFRSGINQDMKLADTGWNDANEKFDYKKFPPAFNTVTMIKLMLMKPSEVTRLLGRLRSAVRFDAVLEPGVPNNAMLGFIYTIDGSSQWLARSNMVIAKDCDAYGKIFMKQRGPRNPGFGELNDNCRPVQPPPPFTVEYDGSLSLAAGQSLTIRTSEAADFRLSRWDGSNAPRNAPMGTLTAARNGRSARYTAPAAIAESDIIVVVASARTGDGRYQAPFLSLLPDLRIVWGGTEARSPARGGAAAREGRAARQAARDVAVRKLKAEVAAKKGAGGAKTRGGRGVATRGRVEMFPVNSQTLAMPQIDLSALAPELPLAPGGARAFSVVPDTDVSWRVVSGPGRINARGTYTAPATIDRPSVTAQIEATATDGSRRSATASIRIVGTPRPIVVRPSRANLRAGGTQAFRVSPGIPVTWSIEDNGPGRMGDPSAPIHREFKNALDALKGLANTFSAKTFTHENVEAEVATFQAAFRTASNTRREVLRTKGRAADQDLSTYRAPNRVKTERRVTLKARATDGSGRTATATVVLYPEGAVMPISPSGINRK